MADEVKVLFGGDTSGLDQATDRAIGDINEFKGSVDGLQGQLGQMAERIRSALNFDGMRAGFSSIGQGVSGMVSRIGLVPTVALGAGAAIAGLAAVAVIGGRAIADWAAAHGDAAERLSNLSQQLGISVTELSAWEAVLASAGVSTNSFETAQASLARNLAAAREGARQQSEAFQALGIDISQNISSSELMLQISDRFAQMADGPEKAALAQQLLGRSGAELIPILNQGAEALRGQMDAAIESGAAVSEAYVAAGLDVDAAMGAMRQSASGFANTLFAELGPAVADMLEGFAQWVSDMMDATRESGLLEAAVGILKVTMAAIGITLGAVGVVLSEVFTAAVLAAIPAVELLKTTVISLHRAFQGDFEGAARAWGEGAERTVNAMAAQLDRAQRVRQNYARYVGDVTTNNSRTPDAGPSTSAQGEEVLARIRAQEAAALQRQQEAAARRQTAAADRAAREARRLAEQRVQATVAGLEAEQEAHRDNYDRWMQIEDQKLSILRQQYGEESRQYQQELRNRERFQRQHAQTMARIEQERLESQRRITEATAQTDMSIAQERLNMERQRIQQMRQLGQISAQEEIAMLAQVNQQEFQLEAAHESRVFELRMATLRSSLEAEGLRPEERARILRQIEELEAGHANRILEIQAQSANATVQSQRDAAARSVQSWQSMLQPVGQAFNGMFQNIYNRTMSFRDAFLQALDQILFSFVQMGINMAMNWAANQLAMTGATTAGVAARTTAEATGAAAGTAASGSMALMDIMNSAWRAAAGAYAAISSIPYVGPFLAPAIAAGILATVVGFAGNIVSSRGGLGRVEKDGQIAELHKDETVLPASLAVPMRDMLQNWNPSRSPAGGMLATAANASGGGTMIRGGDVNLNYQPNNAVMNGGIESVLKRDSTGLKRWFRNEVRNRRLNVGGGN